MATKSTDIATVQTYAAMEVAPRDIADMLLEASGGQRLSPFDLDVIKVPSGQGAPMWAVQSLDGEDAVKTIEGIAILQRTVRSWWETSIEDSGGGSAPDCSSQDGQTGVGAPKGHPDYTEGNYEVRYTAGGEETHRGRFSCADCPLAEFGSDARGRGQACKQNLLLFMLRPESVIPMVVKVPPSSVKPMRNFILRMAGLGIQPFGAVLSLGLKKVAKSGSPAYFEIEPSISRRLDADELTKMRALRESLLPVLAGVRIEAD
jgi:hypothetical protein